MPSNLPQLKEQLSGKLQELGSKEAIAKLFDFASARAYPFAAWQLPNSETLYLLMQASRNLNYSAEELSTSMPAFVISPFEPDPRGLLKLQADLLVSFSTSNTEVSGSTAVLEEILNTLSGFTGQRPVSEGNNSAEITETRKADYTCAVAEAVDQIKQGRIEKVVLSRNKVIDLPDNFSAVDFWYKLADAYPGAFCSVVSVPDLGTWVGASPEVLLEVTDNQFFRTMALAGTQAVQENSREGDVVWSQKEIEEQALVCRYIINCFKHIRLREYVEKGPRTTTAGHVRHLQSTFTVDMEATERPDLPGKMLNLLHPTSAVGGMPKQEALAFINTHEQHNRELYSGFLGPVGINSYTGLFVNLRCMKVLNGKAVLYAGAGITQDSYPEKEWRETELKTSVLSQFLTQPQHT